MTWTDRQRLMLQELGLSVWQVNEAVPDPVVPAAAVTRQVAAAQGVAERAPPRSAPAPRVADRVDKAPPPAPTSVRAAPSAAASAPPGRQAAGPATLSPPDDARARELATLDWSALREAVAGCQACGLCGTRTQTVFGVGHLQAQWMIVGEAPGEQEDLQGEPFVGASGELLDNMLRALGLTRSSDGPATPAQRVYIANTLKCRPPRNRNPAPAELLACEPFLIRQIALLKPRLILAMGRFAVQALLRSSEPVGKLRGRVHTYQGVPLVVTYHPAYLLRNLVDKARAWDDLCLAASVAEAS
jgi:uracil-DNA glycosylase